MLAFKSRVGRKVKSFHAQKSRGKHAATPVSAVEHFVKQSSIGRVPNLNDCSTIGRHPQMIQVIVIRLRETWAQDRRIIWTKDLVL